MSTEPKRKRATRKPSAEPSAANLGAMLAVAVEYAHEYRRRGESLDGERACAEMNAAIRTIASGFNLDPSAVFDMVAERVKGRTR